MIEEEPTYDLYFCKFSLSQFPLFIITCTKIWNIEWVLSRLIMLLKCRQKNQNN